MELAWAGSKEEKRFLVITLAEELDLNHDAPRWRSPGSD
jgi:hypothetical protein